LCGLGRRDGDDGGLLLAGFDGFAVEDGELATEGLDGLVQSAARIDAAVGPHPDEQAVEVGALTDAGVLDAVRDAPHRCVDGVDRDRVDAVLGAVDLGGHVAHAALDPHFHDQFPALRQRGDVQVGDADLGGRGHVEVGGRDGASLLGAQHQRDGFVVMELHDQVLEVEDDLHDILLDPVDGRELVEHVFDVDAGHGRARDGRQQDAPQRVAERHAVAAWQGFDYELTVIVPRLGFELWDYLHRYLLGSDLRALRRSARVVLDDLELVDGNHDVLACWTMQEPALQRLGVELEPRVELATPSVFDVGMDDWVLLRSRVHRNLIAWLEAVRRDVDAFTVDGDVAVRDELTSLAPGVGDAETVHDVVEPRFQELQEHGTRGSFGLGGLGEQVVELLLAHVVEDAQLLLLTQTHTVIAGLAPTALAVLARRVRMRFHQTLNLRRFRQVDAFTAAELDYRPSISTHVSPSPSAGQNLRTLRLRGACACVDGNRCAALACHR